MEGEGRPRVNAHFWPNQLKSAGDRSHLHKNEKGIGRSSLGLPEITILTRKGRRVWGAGHQVGNR